MDQLGEPRVKSGSGTIERIEARVAAWRDHAATLMRYGDPRHAELIALLASEIEEDLHAAEDEYLTLTDAARESGYSADHLGRLVREGKLPNHGRRNAPRVRRRDLPQKVSALRDRPLDGNMRPAGKEEIARAVVTRFREGNDG